MTYTIKEIADLAGVTTRTIRYYDEIGLLSPALTGANGYRYYNEGSLLRLQQILFFRELDFSLKEIQLIMSRPDFNILPALEKHRLALQDRVMRLRKLIDTIDCTIVSIKGEIAMADKDYFEGFDERQYEEETRERWGSTSKYAESQKKWNSYSADQKKAIKAEGGQLTLRMVTNNPDASPEDPDAQDAIGEYHVYVNKYFYACDVDDLRGLADLWVKDPRFAANYEKIRAGGAAFVREAVYIYCDKYDGK
jgi:DNA-binding transcriptional MerR regulator